MLSPGSKLILENIEYEKAKNQLKVKVLPGNFQSIIDFCNEHDIRHLDLSNTELRNEHVADLCNIKGLKSLNISGNFLINDAAFSQLSPHLEVLIADQTEITSDGTYSLALLSQGNDGQLKEVSLQECKYVDNQAAQYLLEVTLNVVKLRGCSLINDDLVVNPENFGVDEQGNECGDQKIEILVPEIDLADTKIGDRMAQRLSKSRKVERLFLENTLIGDIGQQALRVSLDDSGSLLKEVDLFQHPQNGVSP